MTMKSKLITLVLLSSAAVFGQVSVGIRIGRPPEPRVVAVPPTPGPGYVWVGGYYYPVNGRYVWHDGYWTRPPYEGAVWITPHHDGERFFAGYWQRPNGERFEHNHDWDRDRDRDWRDHH
jgi:hypothetical protein